MPKGLIDDERAASELAPTERDGTGTQPFADGHLVARGQLIGRFRIDAPLGSGGMADVFRAHDPVLERAVALKVLHTKRIVGDTQGMRRVLREARAAAALTHPNIVVIFEVGEANGDVFIAMELLEGSVLREVLSRGQASLEDKLRWLLQAARALAAAHGRGLVHRDVKPENMFICADGTLKLLDFGIAKRDDDDTPEVGPEEAAPSSLRTHAGRRLGTPRYMAPEQHGGLATDARTDEYAWGLVAFELLCGTHVGEQQTAPITGIEQPAGVPLAIVLAELRGKVPELPEAVAASIARALEPNKEDRFPSMDPIVRALEARALTAAPTAPPAPARWWVVAVAATVSIVAVLAFIRLRERSTIVPAVAGTKPPNTLPPACRAVATRALHMGAEDRMAILPNGAAVFARGSLGIKLERETPTGTVPLLPHLADAQVKIREARIQGMASGDAWLVVLGLTMESGSDGDQHSVLMTVREGGDMTTTRVGGAPTGFAATSFGKGIVVGVTALPNIMRNEGTRGAAVYDLSERRVVPIENGDVQAPSIAATSSRLALAYQHADETHFALLDQDLRRVGDVMTAMPFRAATALAFAGGVATMFWTDARGPRTRLEYATFTPGEAAFTAPEVALDDPLVDAPPITARLPHDSFAVAWLTSTGASTTLRVSPIGAGGALTGPSDIATAALFRDLAATSTPQGIDFSWNDGAGAVSIAHVSCQPPTSLPDR